MWTVMSLSGISDKFSLKLKTNVSLKPNRRFTGDGALFQQVAKLGGVIKIESVSQFHHLISTFKPSNPFGEGFLLHLRRKRIDPKQTSKIAQRNWIMFSSPPPTQCNDWFPPASKTHSHLPSSHRSKPRCNSWNWGEKERVRDQIEIEIRLRKRERELNLEIKLKSVVYFWFTEKKRLDERWILSLESVDRFLDLHLKSKSLQITRIQIPPTNRALEQFMNAHDWERLRQEMEVQFHTAISIRLSFSILLWDTSSISKFVFSFHMQCLFSCNYKIIDCLR